MHRIEEEVIKHFVVKNKQERILWELGNTKRRAQVFWRFAGSEIFKRECLSVIDYMPPEELAKYLSRFTHAESVYYIGEDYIGEMTLKDSMIRMNSGNICIIYCGNGIAYYQGEEEAGDRPRFLLKDVVQGNKEGGF